MLKLNSEPKQVIENLIVNCPIYVHQEDTPFLLPYLFIGKEFHFKRAIVELARKQIIELKYCIVSLIDTDTGISLIYTLILNHVINKANKNYHSLKVA